MAGERFARVRAKAVPTGDDAFQVQLTGPRAQRIDGDLLASCMNAAIACSELTACNETGLSSRCFETIVGHSMMTGCMEAGFGIGAPSRLRGGAAAVTDLPGQLRARASKTADGIQLQFSGPVAPQIDTDAFAADINSMLACAELNGCLDRGVNITRECVNTLFA